MNVRKQAAGQIRPVGWARRARRVPWLRSVQHPADDTTKVETRLCPPHVHVWNERAIYLHFLKEQEALCLCHCHSNQFPFFAGRRPLPSTPFCSRPLVTDNTSTFLRVRVTCHMPGVSSMVRKAATLHALPSSDVHLTFTGQLSTSVRTRQSPLHSSFLVTRTPWHPISALS